MSQEPMLAPADIPTEEDIDFPIFASEKLDGIRMLVFPQGILNRSFKTPPNQNLTEYFHDIQCYATFWQEVFDGEFHSRTATWPEHLSLWLSHDKKITPDFEFNIFDHMTLPEWLLENEKPFHERIQILNSMQIEVPEMRPPVHVLEQCACSTWDEIMEYYQSVLARGGEGLILRDPSGRYKHGRCTMRERNMFKLKEFVEVDVRVVGFKQKKELFSDALEKTDAFGRMERSGRQEDYYFADKLGALVCKLEDGRNVDVGTGFSEECRHTLWQDCANLLDRWCTIRYATCGVKDRPRIPVFIRWRESK